MVFWTGKVYWQWKCIPTAIKSVWKSKHNLFGKFVDYYNLTEVLTETGNDNRMLWKQIRLFSGKCTVKIHYNFFQRIAQAVRTDGDFSRTDSLSRRDDISFLKGWHFFSNGYPEPFEGIPNLWKSLPQLSVISSNKKCSQCTIKFGNGPLNTTSVLPFAGQKMPATPCKKKPTF